MLRIRERSLTPAAPPVQVQFAVHHRHYKFVLLAVLSVICVFLCPAPGGPWSATHGPATALQAARNALTFFFLIALAAHSIASQVLVAFLLPGACHFSTAKKVESLTVRNLGAVPIRC